MDHHEDECPDDDPSGVGVYRAAAQAHRGETEAFVGRVDAALGPPAWDLVQAYFDRDEGFAADTFDTLGDNPGDQITADDLLAVTLLDVRFRPESVRNLFGHAARRASVLLRAVPGDVALWHAEDEHLAAAQDAWNFLRTQPGIGWVIAGKLMARKRPWLVPIFDGVIREALRPPRRRFWASMRAALADDDRRNRIDRLRPPGLTMKVTTLRLLDVAVWMRHSNSDNAKRVRTNLAVSSIRPPDERRRRNDG